MTRTKVLYIGAGNPIAPAAGMDVVARAHLHELQSEPLLEVKAIVAHHSAVGADGSTLKRAAVTVFAADLAKESSGWRRLFMKAHFILKGGLLCTIGFSSSEAQKAITHELAGAPRVIVVDHLAAMANISLLQLIWMRVRYGTKCIFIAHDITSNSLIDAVVFKTGWGKKIFTVAQAIQVHFYEALLLYLVNRTVFISDYDRRHFHFAPQSKAQSLCPVLESDGRSPDEEEPLGDYLVFIGSPSFHPNAYALRWIVEAFAPALAARESPLKILLVGKGTDRIDVGSLSSVKGLGFVSDAELQRLLRSAVGLLSPIIHGSGIKIKVLEAIASGCPVLASEQSLRGFEFMKLAAMLDVTRPDLSAQKVLAFAEKASDVAEAKRQLSQRWVDYRMYRKNRLANVVLDQMT